MKNKILLLGEAWGEQEEVLRMPFVGPSGYFLNQLLEDAGIRRSDCYVTNVFNLRPYITDPVTGVRTPANDIENLTGPKDQGLPGREPIRPGKYIRAEFAGELERLESELKMVAPNIVICLGGTAAWAIFGRGTIGKSRGAVALGVHGRKAIATYHPTAILRDYSLRAITVADLLKAKRESEFPEIRRPRRSLWIDPTLEDMERFYAEHLLGARRTALDIETRGTFITCIGFAPRVDLGIVVPFWDPRRPGHSYWPDEVTERTAWEWVRRACATPAEKVLQNGLYDLHFLWRRYGITVRNPAHDTMLLHHALQPESEKGLAFLGSVYTDEASWKLMRRHTTTVKRED